MTVRSLAWLAVLPFACAFKNTIPAVAWSSNPSTQLDSLATSSKSITEISHFFDALLQGDDLCQYDAVVVAEQPGLHASDLRALSRDSYLSTRLRDAASSLQIPYLPHSDAHSVDHFTRTLAERCGARLVGLDLAQGGASLYKDEKHIVWISMPQLESEDMDRKRLVRDHEIKLSNSLSYVTSVFPAHLIVYLGSKPLSKRQDDNLEGLSSRPNLSGQESKLAFKPMNGTVAHGGLLQRYRFFTPGVISALLVVFGVLVPIVMVGIYALASIQSPLRIDAPKGPSLEKKNQ